MNTPNEEQYQRLLLLIADLFMQFARIEIENFDPNENTEGNQALVLKKANSIKDDMMNLIYEIDGRERS
jgi:hypothetical protein